MAVFPTMGSGSVHIIPSQANESFVQHPLSFDYGFRTRVTQFLNGSEQRWTVADALVSFGLEFTSVNGYDTSMVRTFFYSQRGMAVNTQLTNTFDMVVKGNVFKYCVFDQDDFSATIDSKETYKFTLKVKQVRRG